jgi:TonB family protein
MKATLLKFAFICTAILSYTTSKAQKATKDSSNTVFSAVETLPQFPGGIPAFSDFIGKNLRYPKEAFDKKIEGRVNVTFIIEKDGSITGVRPVGKYDPMLSQEAVRVVASSPQWKPGMQNNKYVRVQFTVPIIFSLKK